MKTKHLSLAHLIGPGLVMLTIGAAILVGVFVSSTSEPVLIIVPAIPIVLLPLVIASYCASEGRPSIFWSVIIGVVLTFINVIVTLSCLLIKNAGPLWLLVVIGMASVFANVIFWTPDNVNDEHEHTY